VSCNRLAGENRRKGARFWILDHCVPEVRHPGLKFEWLKAWEAHRAKDWPEPPLDAQMRCLEYKRVFDSLIRDRVYEETM
jgi:hypothetical protein